MAAPADWAAAAAAAAGARAGGARAVVGLRVRGAARVRHPCDGARLRLRCSSPKSEGSWRGSASVEYGTKRRVAVSSEAKAIGDPQSGASSSWARTPRRAAASGSAAYARAAPSTGSAKFFFWDTEWTVRRSTASSGSLAETYTVCSKLACSPLPMMCGHQPRDVRLARRRRRRPDFIHAAPPPAVLRSSFSLGAGRRRRERGAAAVHLGDAADPRELVAARRHLARVQALAWFCHSWASRRGAPPTASARGAPISPRSSATPSDSPTS